jgi:hypothetical protein
MFRKQNFALSLKKGDSARSPDLRLSRKGARGAERRFQQGLPDIAKQSIRPFTLKHGLLR